MKTTKKAKKVVVYRECPECRGSGKTTTLTFVIYSYDCDRCNGIGEIETDDYVWVEV